MTAAADPFATWLQQAGISPQRLTPQQNALLQAAFAFYLRTLRRTFSNRAGMVYGTPQAVVVQLDRFAGQEVLTPVIDRFNAEDHRLPWLENRRVLLSLTPRQRNGPGLSRLILNN